MQATNDPNALVVFLYRYPYHAEAAMQLAMVFARTGQMDRAADMVRRSLYIHECAYLEAFKPQNGMCRLDPERPENATYFAGLFRHMQIVGMQGCIAVSLQLARLLLSLDPLADPMAALLSLDYYCLQCQRHDILESYFQSRLPLGYSFEQCELASTFENPPKLTIADLPNWAFSMAASYALRDDIDNAMHAMKTAVYNHPFVVPTLLAECGVNANQTTPVDWSAVLKHEFFAGIADRVHSSSVLLHLAEIYAIRCRSIWQNEALQLMLHRACVDVLEGLTPNLARHLAAQQEKFTALSSIGSPLYKYRTALKEDFKDEYARLPPDMNPLDPHLVDPRALAGRAVLFRHGGALFASDVFAATAEIVVLKRRYWRVLVGNSAPCDATAEPARLAAADARPRRGGDARGTSHTHFWVLLCAMTRLQRGAHHVAVDSNCSLSSTKRTNTTWRRGTWTPICLCCSCSCRRSCRGTRSTPLRSRRRDQAMTTRQATSGSVVCGTEVSSIV